MAKITSREKFKEYILRRLGSPVIDINVDDEQIDDRIDDALLKYRDYHFDGMQHVYYPYQLTQTEIPLHTCIFQMLFLDGGITLVLVLMVLY